MTFATVAALVGLASASYAELQNVEVGGQIRIRANYYDLDESLSQESSWVEQRTRLSVKADFTDEVSMFVELDEWGIWGDSLRTNYITGVDGNGNNGADDASIYQAYIQADQMWGTPLRLRVGRQELSMGSEWLVGTNDTSSFFTGLSFDAIRLDYITDEFSVTGVVSHLADNASGIGGTGNDGLLDDDVVMTALYASYTGLEDITIDAYYIGVYDDDQAGVGVTPQGAFAALEGRRQWGVANPGFLALNNTFDRIAEETTIHTIGLRGAGTYGAFDLESEIAYQFGEIDVDNGGFFGDDDLEYDALAFNLEAGYTFDITWTPRVYLGAAFFEGGDQDNGGFFFGDDDNDLSFNRLFSNWEYSEFLENTDLSNSLIYRAGISAMPTEKISLLLALAYFQADEEVDLGFDGFGIFDLFDNDADDNEGLEVGLYGDYQYSEDLVFRAGFAHFFGDDGLEDGNFVILNGLGAFADTEDDGDYNYLFWEAEISF